MGGKCYNTLSKITEYVVLLMLSAAETCGLQSRRGALFDQGSAEGGVI